MVSSSGGVGGGTNFMTPRLFLRVVTVDSDNSGNTGDQALTEFVFMRICLCVVVFKKDTSDC